MVISAPTVWDVHPWDVSGGELGMGQRRGQTDKSEGQMGGKGWVPCQP